MNAGLMINIRVVNGVRNGGVVLMELAGIMMLAVMAHSQEPAHKMRCYADTVVGSEEQILNADPSQPIIFVMKPELKMCYKTFLGNTRMTGAMIIANNAAGSVSKDFLSA